MYRKKRKIKGDCNESAKDSKVGANHFLDDGFEFILLVEI